MMTFVGYHGTDERGAAMIEENGFEDSSADSWLGPGVYFFESPPGFDGLVAAKWWVVSVKRYPRWVILKADITSDLVFDIFSSEQDRKSFGKLKQQMLKKHLESGGDESTFNLKAVFLMLSRKFEVIRGLVDATRMGKFVNFVVGYPQIQICVTKTKCITNIRMETQGVRDE